ncbi:hypothetical protein QQX98_007066 [Neonectria punicea]|uniref:FAD-binding PCMH-type domain-containing protein n=1 Tax=Neonectria punicea TaxID=979145 RepID=A0ABR1GZI7_9HYPO
MSTSDKRAFAALGLPPSFPIIWQDSVVYERARVGRVFNYRRPSRYPRAVVEATSEDHIVNAVRLANSIGCRVSVRSGGHSWAAWSVREGAVLIDLGKFFHFHLDKDTGVLEASPSMTGRMVNRLLAPHDRMFPGGHCPDVALGGFLLQGGMGWNCKNWGFACEKVLAVDVVTAEGEKLHCDEKENSDIFWAARGAGPGFPAIVTRFYVQTLPSFTHIRSSAYIYEKKDYRKAMEWILRITPNFDESTEIVAVGNNIPGRAGGHITILLLTLKNNEEDARAALQPAQDSAPPGHVISWFAKESSLLQEYDDQHAANPNGHRYAVDNGYIKNDADVISVMEKAFTTLPTEKTFALWYSMGPGSRRSAAKGTMPDMALSMHTDHYFAAYSIWENEYDDKRCQGWVKSVFAQAHEHLEGSYLGDADFQVRGCKFWADEQGKKLMDVRKKWDPRGVVAGYLDDGDKSGAGGLSNENEWQAKTKI